MKLIIVNRVLGYVLVFAGLALIAVPLFQVFNVLAANSLPPELIKMPAVELNGGANQMDIQRQIEDAFQKAMPLDLIYKTLNAVMWAFLLAVFIFGGKQVALIGVKLLMGSIDTAFGRE